MNSLRLLCFKAQTQKQKPQNLTLNPEPPAAQRQRGLKKLADIETERANFDLEEVFKVGPQNQEPSFNYMKQETRLIQH